MGLFQQHELPLKVKILMNLVMGFFFIFALDESRLTDRRSLSSIIVLDDGTVAAETAKTLLSQLQEPSVYTRQLATLEEQQRYCEDIANAWIAEQRDHVSQQANKMHTSLLISVKPLSISPLTQKYSVNSPFEAGSKRRYPEHSPSRN